MKNPKDINTTVLAYIGDAVYEVYVRRYVLEKETVDVNKLNKLAVKYVRAEGQAYAVKKLLEDGLTDEEAALVKRARNRKKTSKPKNADPVVYKLATAFEAFIGYLHLTGQSERLDEIVKKTLGLIESADINNDRTISKKVLKKNEIIGGKNE